MFSVENYNMNTCWAQFCLQIAYVIVWAFKVKFNKYCNERIVSLIVVRFEQVTEIRAKESYNIMYVLMLDEKTIRMVLNIF